MALPHFSWSQKLTESGQLKSANMRTHTHTYSHTILQWG